MQKGSLTVHINKKTSENKKVSVLLCCSASGEKLPPFIVFKGQPNGRIFK